MKNKKYILLLIPSLLVVIILGVTYAWLIQTVNGNKIQAMRVGTFKLSLEEGNSLSLPSSEFMSDEDGLKQDGFTFSVANTGKFTGSYSVYLDDDSINSDQTRLDDKYIKYNLEVNGTKGNSVALNNRKIYEGTLAKGKTDSFVLRIWLNKDVNGDIGGQVFKVKLRIEVNQEITPTPVAEKLLAGVGSNGSIDTSDSEQTFITGTDPNNYIWFSGKLWRAVSIDPTDNSVKLVTQWGITAIPYTSNGKSDFKGSYVEEWLNNTSTDGFLGSLREPEKFIKMDSVWNATITTETSKPPKTTLVTDAVGMINLYEYTMSHINVDISTGYLNNKLWWYLLNSANSIKWQMLDQNGNVNLNNSYSFAVRPSINLQSNIKIVSGTGTSDNPYRLAGDDDKNLSGTLLSTRYSGEYISFGIGENNLYRIVSHENGNGTKITSDIPLREKGQFDSMAFDTNLSVNYSTDITIGSFLNNAFLTSLKFISSDQVKMIEDSTTWYLGTISANDNPNNIKNSNDKISLKIGMLRLGELMACQQSYSLPENPSFRLLTPYSTTEIRDIGGSGDSYYDSPSIQRGIRPAMNLKSNVVITGGDGTKSNPFTIALNQ